MVKKDSIEPPPPTFIQLNKVVLSYFVFTFAYTHTKTKTPITPERKAKGYVKQGSISFFVKPVILPDKPFLLLGLLPC